MADASFLQTSFLGGEWAPYAQGRADRDDYRTGLKLCYNSLPVEEGAWVRRPGFKFIAPTRFGQRANLQELHKSQAASIILEFTEGFLRFQTDGHLILDGTPVSVVSISGGTPAVITTSPAHGWVDGDEVEFQLLDLDETGSYVLFNRQFVINVSDATHFSIADSVTTNAVVGASISYNGEFTVDRVVTRATPYTGAKYVNVQVVQTDDRAYFLQPDTQPWLFRLNGMAGPYEVVPTFFIDGPYLDPETDGSTLTPSGLSGNITLTSSIAKFVSTDVGRLIRLFSQPPAWVAATAYSAGQPVTYNGEYWRASAASTGAVPGTDATLWAVDTSAAAWTSGAITAVTNSTTVNFTVFGVEGAPILYIAPIAVWRFGLYSDTTAWPTCGTFHQGRLWLGGAQPNRIDGSSLRPELYDYDFGPTSFDGTVSDANGMALVLQANNSNVVFWMSSGHQGINIGTQGGEWLIQASAQNDPITPTSVSANRVTTFGCANVPAIKTPSSLIFVHRNNTKVVEYLAASSFSAAKYDGLNISSTARHLVRTGVVELAYTQEPIPVVWAMDSFGDLVGMTYKREPDNGPLSATFAGWHWHRPGVLVEQEDIVL